jgi:hypothetical protein
LQALRLDGAGVEECFATTGAGTGEWTVVMKRSDQAITEDNNLNFDNDLFFTMAADAHYTVRGVILFTSNELADFQYTFLCPNVDESVWDSRWTVAGNPDQTFSPKNVADEIRFNETVGVLGTCAVEGAASRTITWATDANGLVGRVEIHGTLAKDSSSGKFRFLWAQGTLSEAPTTVLAGSYIEYTTF